MENSFPWRQCEIFFYSYFDEIAVSDRKLSEQNNLSFSWHKKPTSAERGFGPGRGVGATHRGQAEPTGISGRQLGAYRDEEE